MDGWMVAKSLVWESLWKKKKKWRKRWRKRHYFCFILTFWKPRSVFHSEARSFQFFINFIVIIFWRKLRSTDFHKIFFFYFAEKWNYLFTNLFSWKEYLTSWKLELLIFWWFDICKQLILFFFFLGNWKTIFRTQWISQWFCSWKYKYNDILYIFSDVSFSCGSRKEGQMDRKSESKDK